MLASLGKAFAQLSDRRFRRVLLLGLAATAVLYAVLYLAVGWALSKLQLFGIGWADTLSQLLGGIAVFLLTLVMFPGIATMALSVFLNEVSAAVDAKHYPSLPPPRRQSMAEVAWVAVRFAVVSMLVNFVALPLYVLLLFFGIGAVIYYLANGYLLAREYFELVAWRRLRPAEADAVRRAHAWRLWLMGMVIAVLSTVPGLNLLAPLVATAAMVHEVEALRPRPPGP
jgi:uncharacterized protein involved in cysteine biosynthesis